MREAADHRAAIPDPQVPDQGQGVGDCSAASQHRRVSFEVALPAERAHHQHVTFQPVVGQAFDAVEVDDRLGPGQAQVEERHQALPAGQGPSLVAVGGQQADGLGHFGGGVVLEGRGLHAALSVMGGVRSARRMRAASCGEAPKAQMMRDRTPLSGLGQYLVTRS